jgi:hypothetical protein
MKSKGTAHILIGSLLCVILMMPTPAQAGSAARHRWEGALIGLGAGAFLAGAALVPPPVAAVAPVPVPVPVPVRNPFIQPGWVPGFPPPPPPFPPRGRDWERDRDWRRHGDWDRDRHDRHGHWETRRVWVPPVFEDNYREGHYNRWGEWVPGHWNRIMVRPGFWKEDREWVHR